MVRFLFCCFEEYYTWVHSDQEWQYLLVSHLWLLWGALPIYRKLETEIVQSGHNSFIILGIRDWPSFILIKQVQLVASSHQIRLRVKVEYLFIECLNASFQSHILISIAEYIQLSFTKWESNSQTMLNVIRGSFAGHGKLVKFRIPFFNWCIPCN